MMDSALIYDFCLEWLMLGESNKDYLIVKFKSYKWSFVEFKRIAINNNWFVESMEVLC